MASIPPSSGTASIGSSSDGDPARKYGVVDPNNRNNWQCKFCGRVLKGGAHRLKQHLVGGFRNAKKCLKCPAHVSEEVKSFMEMKHQTKLSREMLPNVSLFDENYDEEEDEEEDGDDGILKFKRVSGSSDTTATPTSKFVPKRPRQKGPMDKFCTPKPEDAIKARKDGQGGWQKSLNASVHKDLRERACRDIARWFYDAGIPFNAATYDSFAVMLESVGQYGPGLKQPTMHELRVPFLKKEVEDTQKKIKEHEQEWVEKGCSILSDGWRDSVVQKDILNFLVNSPKGSVFIKSMDVSDITKDAYLLFRLLDDLVEEVGEQNVVQVVTDNASNYVKAGKNFDCLMISILFTLILLLF